MTTHPDDPSRSPDDRLEALERSVDALQEKIRELEAKLSSPSPDGGAAQAARRVHPRTGRPMPPRQRRERATRPSRPLLPKIQISTEELLKWSGIALVLIALAFLFKYAVDEGWLTPAIRLVIGFAAALILLGLGRRAYPKRPRWGQVLEGGGIATFYITLFAAFQVLDVLPYEAAFVGMACTTVLALALALWQEDAGLAVFGLLGGLATPFLLYTGSGDVAALVSYAALLLSATTAIYLWKGWRSMLYTTVIGGWAVFVIASNELRWPIGPAFGDHLAVQLSAVFSLAAFWVAPVVRSIVSPQHDPIATLESPRVREGAPGDDDRDRPAEASTGLLARLEWMFRNVVHLLVIITPLIALSLTAEAWRLTDTVQGIIMFGLAGIFGGAAAYLSTIERDNLAYTHWLATGIMVTIGLMLILDGNALLAGLAAEVLILHVLASRLDDRWPLVGAHLLALVVFLWMGARLDESGRIPPIVNMRALTDLVVIALAVSSSLVIRNRQVGLAYLALAYVGLLAWFSRELTGYENGQALVTAAWSVCGVVLLIAGMGRTDKNLRAAGLITLAVVVAKLFLVDLAELDPIWRILLFLGVGAGFLLLGWFVPSLWGPIGRDQKSEVRSQK